MRTRIFIVGCILLGTATASILWEQSGWKATLRRELHRYTSRSGPILPEGMVLHMQVHYTVPAEAAKILEGRQREELLSYLPELRKGASPLAELMVGYWIEIVSEGVHGTPQTMRCYHDSEPEEVAVYSYAIPMLPDRPHP